MWSYVSQARPHHAPLISPKPLSHIRSLSRSRLVVSAAAAADHGGEIGALGRTILESLKASPKPQELKGTSKPTQDDDQIRGSDVLWAMKKVADNKTKRRTTTKKKNGAEGREVLSSAGGGREEFRVGGDYQSDDDDNVRPLVVKREWSVKLAELEKRLDELCLTK